MKKSTVSRRTVDRAHGTGHCNPKRKSKNAIQETLPFRSWGGARPGAGRKRQTDRPRVPHRVRDAHARSRPVQVTSRLVPGVRSLRSAAELAVVREALERSRRKEFQVVHHSVQSSHLHLIVEADDRKTLTSGLRGLLVRLARELNRLWQRRGCVFADRFHERELRTLREVRNSLLYVLHNARKHGIWMRGPDPCSSGAVFDGWEPARERNLGLGTMSAQSRRPRTRGKQTEIKRAALERPAGALLRREKFGPRARTWLLGVGWQRHGLLRETEVPQGSFGRIEPLAKSASRARVG